MEDNSSNIILRDKNKKSIVPRTSGQEKLINAVYENNIVFVDGPAGTGKTFLAAALAVKFLREGKVERIIMSRPAVEAGENLGFLPGTLEEKIDPYLTPLFDCLETLFTFEETARLQHNRQIEVIPLAFMRGRTLANSFLVLDEAQNTTSSQMKMFLTRIGENSKMIVAGDSTQQDLFGKSSGLIDAFGKLNNVKGITTIKLTIDDVVRADIVSRIIRAYEV